MTLSLLAKAALLGGAAYVASRAIRSSRLVSNAPAATAAPVAPLPNNELSEDVRSFTPVAAIGAAV